MKKILLLTMLLFVICGVTSGCSRQLHIAIPLEKPDEYEIDSIAVAVDYFGVKHIARKVCEIGSTSECFLQYIKMVSGSVSFVWSWVSTSQYLGVDKIDIAVTDSGIAAIGWGTVSTAGGIRRSLYVLSNNLTSVNEINPGYVSGGAGPYMAAKLNYLYALDSITDGAGGYGLRYVQLVGGTASGWATEHNNGTTNAFRDAAVSPSGKLYLTYWRTPDGDIMYADNFGTTGDVTNYFRLVGPAYDYTAARIDVNGSTEVVYVTYTHIIVSGSSDLLVIGHCPANNCTFGTYEIEVPLNTSLLWSIIGPADVIADTGNTVYFAFNARNVDTGSNLEVFEGYFQDPNFSVFNVSNTAGDDGEPIIGLMWSIIPVTGWVTGNDIYQYDAYPFILPYASLRLIHHTEHPILTNKVDMYTNADWGAGMWIEDQANQQDYVIFNTYPSVLPIIIR